MCTESEQTNQLSSSTSPSENSCPYKIATYCTLWNNYPDAKKRNLAHPTKAELEVIYPTPNNGLRDPYTIARCYASQDSQDRCYFQRAPSKFAVIPVVDHSWTKKTR